MKFPLQSLAIFIFILFTSSTSANNDNQLPAPIIKKINERVYALLGPLDLPNRKNRGYMVNSTVIIGDKGVILIDTGFSHEIGLHIKNTISKITDKPVTHVINTHDHGDHTLGNSAFSNAVIISSEKCKAVMEKSGYEWIGLLENMTGLKFPDSKPVVASMGYPESTHTNISLQGIKMEIWVPMGSHTSNDLMVYLPDDGILIAGDILVKGIVPSFRDAYVSNWIGTLQQISKMKLSTIVPGHGDLMTVGDVKEMYAYMEKLYSGIEAGYKKGLMDSEIRKELDLSKWKKMKHFDDLMGMNINRTYLEVEAANF